MKAIRSTTGYHLHHYPHYLVILVTSVTKPTFDDFRQSILRLRYLLPRDRQEDSDIEELERTLDLMSTTSTPPPPVMHWVEPPPDQPVGSWQMNIPEWWKKKREENKLVDEVTQEARAERYRTAWIVTCIGLVIVVCLWAVLK